MTTARSDDDHRDDTADDEVPLVKLFAKAATRCASCFAACFDNDICKGTQN